MPVRSGPCAPWATRDDLTTGVCAWGRDGTGDDIPDSAVLDQALQVASSVLFHLTGGIWPGPCTDTVRPVVAQGPIAGAGFWGGGIAGPPIDLYASSLFTEQAWPFSGGSSRWWPYGRLSCPPRQEIVLEGPVTAIGRVTVDGTVLDPSAYTLLDGRRLIRTDGGIWPVCQDVSLPTTETGTLEVAYTFGKPPPPDAVAMCALLACEYAQVFEGSLDGTRFPRATTAVTREGVSIAILAPADAFDKGRTGFPEIDLWIESLRTKRRRPVFESADTWAASRLRRVGL